MWALHLWMEIAECVSVMLLRTSRDITMRPSRVLVKNMWIWGEISIISPAGTRIPLKERTGTVFQKKKFEKMLALTAWVGRNQGSKSLTVVGENEQNFGAVGGRAEGKGVDGRMRGELGKRMGGYSLTGKMTKDSLCPGLLTTF